MKSPEPLLPPSVTPVASEFQLLIMKVGVLPPSDAPKPPTVPRLTFFRSPAGWWTAVTAVPVESVDASHPAKTAPAGGALLRRISIASEYESA